MWTRITLAALVLAPSPLVGQRLRTQSTNIIAPPPFLVASGATGGVRLTWGTALGATQYQVLRGPDGTQLAPIGALAAPDTVYFDGSNTSAATYQVRAVNAYGSQALSPLATYSPPATIVRTGTTTLSTQTLSAYTPPVVSSLGTVAYPQINSARNGDEVLVQGTGLDGLTSVMVQVGYSPYSNGSWVTNPNAAPIAITPAKSTSTSFTFVPQLPVPYNLTQTEAYLVIVTKGTMVDTSNAPIFVAGKLPVRQITSVASAVVRSGQRVKITGVGFDNVIGGYFGNGTPGSVGNPMLTMWNRSSTYVELATPTTCDMAGTLMLEQPQAPEGQYITGATPIQVTCVPGNPTGTVISPALDANKVGYAMPGSKIQIAGKYLRYVTRVLDQRNTALPFTITTGVGSDFLTVTLPAGSGGVGYGFSLENSLIDPVLNFTVTGTIITIGPPQFIRFETAWAEPGQLVNVVGQQLKWTALPKAYVGGVPGQIVSAGATALSFRMPSNAVSGPVEIENEGGRVRFDGPYPIRVPAVTHSGFFLVVGPSVVTQVLKPRPTLALGDTLTVVGQNLARLGGICLPGANGQGYVSVRRPEAGNSAQQGWISSNTSMFVVVVTQPYVFGSGPVQLFANAQPVGDYPPTQFACAPNPQVVNWP